MSSGNLPPDPEDMFQDSRMSFGDHIEELRTHLWKGIYGFGIALVLSFFVGKPVLEFIAAPVEAQMKKFFDRRVENVRKRLLKDEAAAAELDKPTEFMRYGFYRPQLEALLKGQPLQDVNDFPPPDGEGAAEGGIVRLWLRVENPLKQSVLMAQAYREVGRQPTLTTLSAQEAFMVYFKVCMVCGLVIGSPWIFYQIWQFVAAGLYPHEKRYVHLYLPFSLGLFLAGVFLCQFFVIPKALEALLWFNEWLGMEPDLRLNEWLSFAILMPLVFGVSFQTPLVMFFIERIGIVSVQTYREKRRMAWFLMAVFSALITPSVDAVSMLFLWLPLGLLYELGIFMCWMSPREPDLDMDVPDSEEMIEV